MKKILVGPFTRANNSSAVEVIVENKKVVDARCISTFFRGFELILQGRDPRDASYLTQRICGICSSVHGAAACLALEDAVGVRLPHNGSLLRNLIMGADFLQNHIRHIYLFSMVDYITLPNVGPFVPSYSSDKRLSQKANKDLIEHFYQSLDIGRLAHELMALLGGKAPFPHGILAGGSTVPPTADIIMNFKSKLKRINQFIKNVMLADIFTIAEAYSDYYEIGCRQPNLLGHGIFPLKEDDRERYFPGGAVLDGQLQKVDPSLIKEHVSKAWYAQEFEAQNPVKGETEPDPEKDGAYSWSKAPRYKEKSLEGGPLARLWIRGDYRRGISTMDRVVCRALEAEKISALMEKWLDELEMGKPVISSYQIPKETEGMGLIDAMRGPLGHWIRIEKGRISHYQIITPTSWNFSPRDDQGQLGPVEEALIGTPVADDKEPIEIGRVIRAFDVCSSCSAHVMVPGSSIQEVIILP